MLSFYHPRSLLMELTLARLRASWTRPGERYFPFSAEGFYDSFQIPFRCVYENSFESLSSYREPRSNHEVRVIRDSRIESAPPSACTHRFWQFSRFLQRFRTISSDVEFFDFILRSPLPKLQRYLPPRDMIARRILYNNNRAPPFAPRPPLDLGISSTDASRG